MRKGVGPQPNEKAAIQIDSRREVLCRHIPENRRNIFMDAVKNAVSIYLETPDKVRASKEIKNLAKALRRPDGNVAEILSSISEKTRKINVAYGGPDLSKIPEDKQALEDICGRVCSTITAGGLIQRTTRQQRLIRKTIAELPKGRPSTRREEALIGFLASAFAAATSKAVTRSWSEDTAADLAATSVVPLEDDVAILSLFEEIVVHVLKALGVENRVSAKNLIRRHIENRDSAL